MSVYRLNRHFLVFFCKYLFRFTKKMSCVTILGKHLGLYEEILRIHLIDFLRGVSVIAMMVYHFIWDLGYFKFIDLKTVTQGLSLFFAQCIGASFIIISGISFRILILNDKFRKKFLKRLSILVFICIIITLVTYLLDNNSFIFFGILHFLATCSIISFLLIRFINKYTLFILFFVSSVLSVTNVNYSLPAYLSWIGFNENVPSSNDFYPLFPWVSFYFFGLWVGNPVRKYLLRYNEKNFDSHYSFYIVYRSLRFLGKNSLPIYILHQPIFFSLFLIFIRISS